MKHRMSKLGVRRFGVSLGAVLASFAATCPLAGQSVQKETFKVAMRDGVKLATDVYFPSTNRAFPVLLARTPYNKTISIGAGEDGAGTGM